VSVSPCHFSPLLGQRAQGLGQQPDLLHPQRQLAGLGLEQGTLGADDIAQIPALEPLVIVALDQSVALHEQLQAATHVLQVGEAGLAHHPPAHHAARQPHPQTQRLQLQIRQFVIAGM
jgi:hypothetical protein